MRCGILVFVGERIGLPVTSTSDSSADDEVMVGAPAVREEV
jgi:hypothetical protein